MTLLARSASCRFAWMATTKPRFAVPIPLNNEVAPSSHCLRTMGSPNLGANGCVFVFPAPRAG